MHQQGQLRHQTQPLQSLRVMTESLAGIVGEIRTGAESVMTGARSRSRKKTATCRSALRSKRRALTTGALVRDEYRNGLWMVELEHVDASRANVEYQPLDQLDSLKLRFNVADRRGRDFFEQCTPTVKQIQHGACASQKELIHFNCRRLS
jgi:hypothetical protein